MQGHIAHIEMDRAASDALVERPAEAKQASDAAPHDAKLAAEADFRVAEAKFFASNAGWDAADRAVQVFGGAAGRSCIVSAGTCRTCGFAASTKGPTKSCSSKSPRRYWARILPRFRSRQVRRLPRYPSSSACIRARRCARPDRLPRTPRPG